jgi:hypothetical protein
MKRLRDSYIRGLKLEEYNQLNVFSATELSFLPSMILGGTQCTEKSTPMQYTLSRQALCHSAYFTGPDSPFLQRQTDRQTDTGRQTQTDRQAGR